MQKSRLIQLLSSLSPKEFKKLGEMAHSPIYNKYEKVQLLYEVIAPHFGDWENEALQKERVFKKVFAHKTYDDKHLRALMSDLAQLAETLLVKLQLETDPFMQQQLLFQAADQRGMNKLREDALNDMAFAGITDQLNNTFLYNRMETEKSRYDHFLKTRNRSTGNVLQDVLDSLDANYLHQKLKYTCEAVNRSAILSETYQNFMQDDIMTRLADGAFQEHPLIRAYYQVLLTLKHHEDEQHYFGLKELLANQSASFPVGEAKVLYAYAQNYCIRKINTGGNAYLQELFDLYKKLLESKIILDGQHITQWDFKNIVSVSVRLGNTDWAEQFINQYKGLLPTAQKDNAVQYNLASLRFYKREFGKVARILQRVEFTDVFYNLDSRSLLIKTYYELNEYDALFQFSDTFSNYLRRNKQISGYQKTVYLNLVKYLTRMARIKLRESTIPAKLKEEILSSREVADATWLKNKVEELS